MIGKNEKHFVEINDETKISGAPNLIYTQKVEKLARFIRISIKNIGLIPENNPGAGNNAWIFLDEIEVK